MFLALRMPALRTERRANVEGSPSKNGKSMYEQSPSGACLTVVEFGVGEPTAVLDSFAMAAEAHATVVQQVDETPAELATRVVRRVRQLTRGGIPLLAGAIMANEDVGDEAFQGRCQIARAMIRAMRGAPTGSLTFLAPTSLSDEGRHELLAIAGTLASQLRGMPVEVSVRFDSRPPVSKARLRTLDPTLPAETSREGLVA
jgi:hypothetical protein